MITGITESGFEFELEDDVLDDYDVFEALHQLEKGNVGYVADVVNLILGDDQKKRLKEHVRKIKGKCSLSGMYEEIHGILEASRQGKNS